MDLGLTDGQRLMTDAARDWLERNWPGDLAAAWIDGEADAPPEGPWRRLAELGWFGLAVSEPNGGLGGEFLDFMLLQEEFGAALFPSTYASTLVTARLLDRLASDDEQKRWVSALAAGKIGTLALYEADGAFLEPRPTTELLHEDGGWVLRGGKLFVRDGVAADYVVVLASEPGVDELRWVVVEQGAEAVNRSRQLSLARDRQCELTLVGTPIDEGHVFPASQASLERAQIELMLAECAYLVGVTARGHAMAVKYAQERVAFGRPIGAFQAIQHKVSDMTIDLESSRLITHFAATRVGADTALEDAMNAKWWVSQAANRVLREAQQIHGGLGFTTDFPLHRYFKRAKTGELMFGAPHELVPRMASLVLQPERAELNSLATV